LVGCVRRRAIGCSAYCLLQVLTRNCKMEKHRRRLGTGLMGIQVFFFVACTAPCSFALRLLFALSACTDSYPSSFKVNAILCYRVEIRGEGFYTSTLELTCSSVQALSKLPGCSFFFFLLQTQGFTPGENRYRYISEKGRVSAKQESKTWLTTLVASASSLHFGLFCTDKAARLLTQAWCCRVKSHTPLEKASLVHRHSPLKLDALISEQAWCLKSCQSTLNRKWS